MVDFRRTTQVTLVSAGATPATEVTSMLPAPTWELWDSAPVSINSSGYTVAWQSPVGTTAGSFWEAAWQINSDDLFIKITLGSKLLVNGLSFQELEDDFKFKSEDDSTSGSCFSIWQYESKRWVFRPVDPIFIPTGEAITISFKSKGTSAKVRRGISGWGSF